MTCDDARALIQGYLDGELDLLRTLEFDRHLRDCPSCGTALARARELNSSIRAQAGYYNAPGALKSRIRSALPRSGKAWPALQPRGWLAMGAALAFAMVTAGTLMFLAPSEEDRLGDEVVAGHVRSLMADHLTDVASSDQHTVKPWFNGKLDFSLPVADFAADGYSLVGGRLDYFYHRPVAALAYHHRLHTINLFVWPGETARDIPAKDLSRQGYNIVCWTQSGLTYWAISDVNRTDLNKFASLVQKQSG